MITLLISNIGTIAVLLVLCGIVCFAVRSVAADKKAGCASCGGNCGCCGACGGMDSDCGCR